MKRELDIEKLIHESKYETGEMARIDWVAGGNFDGYIYKKQLVFSTIDNIVTLKTLIVNQERYDGVANDFAMKGKFEAGSKNTISCSFVNFHMRGKILGEQNQFIVFSVSYFKINKGVSECYILK